MTEMSVRSAGSTRPIIVVDCGVPAPASGGSTPPAGKIRRYRAVASPLLLLVLAAAPAAAAQDAPTTVVETVDCGDALDAAEIARLFSIELSTVLVAEGGGERALAVTIRCDGSRVHIEAEDRLTDKALRRTLPAVPVGPDRERVVALALAQLVVASWLELLIPLEDLRAARASPQATTADAQEAARGVAWAAVDVERSEPGPHVGPIARVGARLHGVDEPWLAVQIGAGLSWSASPRWLVDGRIDYEQGTANRVAGDVDVRAVGLALSAGHAIVSAGDFALVVDVAVHGRYVTMAGAPATEGFAGGTVGGLGWEVAIGMSPRVRVGPAYVALHVPVGWSSGPRGTVTGEADVTYRGLVTGVALSLALAPPGAGP